MNWTEAISLRHWTEGYCRNKAYSHSSVIGSWLLEKSCHDMDQFNWLLDKTCERVASFGSRSFFAPRSDVPKRCTEECPILKNCLYAYVPEATGMSSWLTPEELVACVYHVQSDLFDHHAMILEYEGGATVSFNLVPSVPHESRTMTIYGTEGTVSGDFADNRISVHGLRDGAETIFHPQKSEADHGGSDVRTALAFLDYLDVPANRPKTGVREGFEAVLLACASVTAAKEHRVVELRAFRSDD
jgi:predicted dehydrogenase